MPYKCRVVSNNFLQNQKTLSRTEIMTKILIYCIIHIGDLVRPLGALVVMVNISMIMTAIKQEMIYEMHKVSVAAGPWS